MILAGVYTSSLVYFVQNDSDDISSTTNFLKKQLQCIGKIGKFKNILCKKTYKM
jgi:ubiquinone biosynthesis protein COQ9